MADPIDVRQPTYDRPVRAKLMVQLDNGESWEATDDDLKNFGLLVSLDAQNDVRRALTDMCLDPESEHASIRHTIQMYVAGTPDHVGQDCMQQAREQLLPLRPKLAGLG